VSVPENGTFVRLAPADAKVYTSRLAAAGWPPPVYSSEFPPAANVVIVYGIVAPPPVRAIDAGRLARLKEIATRHVPAEKLVVYVPEIEKVTSCAGGAVGGVAVPVLAVTGLIVRPAALIVQAAFAGELNAAAASMTSSLMIWLNALLMVGARAAGMRHRSLSEMATLVTLF
jgi:hypothetical protein